MAVVWSGLLSRVRREAVFVGGLKCWQQVKGRKEDGGAWWMVGDGIRERGGKLGVSWHGQKVEGG